MTKLDEYLDRIVGDNLSEGPTKKTTFTKITRQTKIDRAIGSLATRLAKTYNDPLYNKMVKFREKYFKYREKIKVKYSPRVRARAVNGKGISDLIAKAQKTKSGK